jgi:arsenite transporter
MVAGLLLGRAIPGLDRALSAVQLDGISLPIAVGLLVMMYPVLAKVRCDRLDAVTGDRKLMAASLVLNWVLGPALMFALAWLLLPDLPEPWQIAKSVLIFLGVPLVLGYLSRVAGERVKGRDGYEGRFLPKVGPWALYGLLFTIVILFALQGAQITSRPWDVARIAVPLLVYFAVMWGGGLPAGGDARTGVSAHHHAGVYRRG